MSDVNSSAGSFISVSAAAPSTFDAAGYNALSWAEVGEVSNLGEFGGEDALVTFNPVKTRDTKKLKGARNAGSMALQIGLDESDAGQILMQEAADSTEDFYFRVTTQNGNKYFYPAKVMGWKVNVGGVGDVTMANTTLEITSNNGVGIVKDVA